MSLLCCRCRHTDTAHRLDDFNTAQYRRHDSLLVMGQYKLFDISRFLHTGDNIILRVFNTGTVFSIWDWEISNSGIPGFGIPGLQSLIIL